MFAIVDMQNKRKKTFSQQFGENIIIKLEFQYMYENDWHYLVYILNKSLVHICGICAHSRSFSNKNILRSFCWWSPFSNHFVDGLLLVNMFIITTKMHIDEGLFCKHVYYQYKNLSYRILIPFEGWHCVMSVDVCLVDLQSLHLSVPLQSTRHRYSEKTSACHSNPLPSLLIWWKTRVFSYHYCLV